jgi:hypothetical protein
VNYGSILAIAHSLKAQSDSVAATESAIAEPRHSLDRAQAGSRHGVLNSVPGNSSTDRNHSHGTEYPLWGPPRPRAGFNRTHHTAKRTPYFPGAIAP